MNVFVQGMRHSGTAILYEALLNDPGMRCFFEPFREEIPTPGGDSSARSTGLFDATRELRREFQREHTPQVPLELFNHGGPRAPALELHPGLPEWALDFLRYMLDQGERTMIKEVRFFRKVAQLHQLDPSATFVHVVRDPRAVSASMMLGRNQRRLSQFKGVDSFFEAWSRRRMWSARDIADSLLNSGDYPLLRAGAPDFMRPLLGWHTAFTSTHDEGLTLFGERYLLVRIEDLRADPHDVIERIYATMGAEVPVEVADWAGAGVRGRDDIEFGDDPRWAEAVGLIGMGDVLAEAGYGEIAELRRADGPRVKLSSPDEGASSRLDAVIGRARRGVDRAAGRARR